MGIGMRELVIILLVVLVVFGAKKLRTVGSDLGHAVRGFKKAMSEGEEEQSTPPKPPSCCTYSRMYSAASTSGIAGTGSICIMFCASQPRSLWPQRVSRIRWMV